MIPQETIDQILDAAHIEDVVGDFVTLKRRGASFVACCPFHNEKTPSFYVTPSKGIYKCFGCGKAGTALSFVMEHEHYSYVEALRYLARKYNIEIVEKDLTAEEITLRQRRESILLASEYAQKFFVRQLSTPEGRAVGYTYFRRRGLEDDTIRKFGLGWAPSGRTTLVDAAQADGFKLEYLLAAGVAVQREDGSVVDKFRERVMFPIHSVSGRVVAFSGRTLKSDNPAKYVNSAETEIYVKSRNLLGIWFAKSEIARQGKCILVEGNLDMVTMHQLGIGNVVASCGTALTIEQIRLIHKFTDNVTIMYDGDAAGIHAALRGLDLVLEEGLNVKIVLLPEGEDPDTFCRSHTLAQVQDYIAEGERDFIDFKTSLLLEQAGNDPLKKANLINDIADSIAKIPDAVKRSVYVQATANRFGIDSTILFQRVAKDRNQPAPSVSRPVSEEQHQPVEADENPILAQAEKDLLWFLLTHGCDFLEFESDSEYYSGCEDEKPTVADFIRGALEADDTQMENSSCREVYESYMALYDLGLQQDEIVRRMLNSQNRRLADNVMKYSTEMYQLTVGSFEAALTATATMLVHGVPKAIMVYNERRIQDKIDKILRQLAHSEESEQTKLMQTLMKLQSTQRRVRQMIGREKNMK